MTGVERESQPDQAVITTVVLTQEQARWLLELGARLFPPRNPLARPPMSRTLRAVLDWAMRTHPSPEAIFNDGEVVSR